MFLVDTNVWLERLLDLQAVGKTQVVTARFFADEIMGRLVK